MRVSIKDNKIVKTVICFLVSILCVAMVAALLLLLSSLIIAKTSVSESASTFIAIVTYSISSMGGSVIFCILSRIKGIICGAMIGVSTCIIKLILNGFSVTSFQFATYGCIIIVCVIIGIMTANILSNKELKY